MNNPIKSPKILVLLILLLFACNMKAMEQGKMVIHYNDGTVKEYAIADIQKLTFDQATSAHEQAILLARFIELKAYPNPARELINIDYTLHEAGHVLIDILNINGQRAFFSNRGNQPAGHYLFQWNTHGMLPGLYICRIQQNDETILEKIMINK